MNTYCTRVLSSSANQSSTNRMDSIDTEKHMSNFDSILNVLMLPVKSKTAGAVMTTDRPCGMMAWSFSYPSGLYFLARPEIEYDKPWQRWHPAFPKPIPEDRKKDENLAELICHKIISLFGFSYSKCALECKGCKGYIIFLFHVRIEHSLVKKRTRSCSRKSAALFSIDDFKWLHFCITKSCFQLQFLVL